MRCKFICYQPLRQWFLVFLTDCLGNKGRQPQRQQALI